MLKAFRLVVFSVFLCVFTTSCGVNMEKLPGLWEQVSTQGIDISEKDERQFLRIEKDKASFVSIATNGKDKPTAIPYVTNGNMVAIQGEDGDLKVEVEDVNDEDLILVKTGDKNSVPVEFTGRYKRIGEERLKELKLNL